MPSVLHNKQSPYWWASMRLPLAGVRRVSSKIPLDRPKAEVRAWALSMEALGRRAERGDESALAVLVSNGLLSAEQGAALLDQYRSKDRALVAAQRSGFERNRSLEKAVDSFMESSSLAKKTLVNYKTTYDQFISYVTMYHGIETTAAAFSASIIAAFMRHRREAMKANAKTKTGARAWNMARAALSTLADFLVSTGNLDRNPVLEVTEQMPYSAPERQVLTVAELDRLFRAADEYSNKQARSNDYGALVRLMASTGIRTVELRHLQWRDLDLDPPRGGPSVLHLRAKPEFDFFLKNYEERKVPLAPDLAHRLRLWKARLAEDWPYLPGPSRFVLVGSSDGPEVNEASLGLRPIGETRKSFKTIFEAAGLAFTGLHILRHTTAVMWLKSGMEVPVVKRLLGHKSIKVTMGYLEWIQGEDWLDQAALVAARSLKSVEEARIQPELKIGSEEVPTATGKIGSVHEG